MIIGLFLNTNQYSGLYVREIVSCLSPVMRVFDIPETVTDAMLKDAIAGQGLGWTDFSGRYGTYTVLKEADWLHTLPRFNYNVSYETLMRGATFNVHAA